jgi:hypothetical protein
VRPFPPPPGRRSMNRPESPPVRRGADQIGAGERVRIATAEQTRWRGDAALTATICDPSPLPSRAAHDSLPTSRDVRSLKCFDVDASRDRNLLNP